MNSFRGVEIDLPNTQSPYLAANLVGNRNAPEAAVHTINTMQAILDRAKLSRVYEQMFWRTLLDMYVAAAKPDLSIAPDMGKVFDETKTEVQISNDQAPS